MVHRYRFAILTALIMAGYLYVTMYIVIHRRRAASEPVAVATIPPVELPPARDEVVVGVSDALARGDRETAVGLYRSAAGAGDDAGAWILLNMAVRANRDTRYESIAAGSPPVVTIALRDGALEGGLLCVGVTVANPGPYPMNVPRVPVTVEGVFSDGAGGADLVVPGTVRYAAGTGDGVPRVIRLGGESCWGFTVDFERPAGLAGPCDLRARLTFSERVIDGRNMVHGIFASAPIRAIL
ncbi:MAG: hypothetical protein ABIF71_05370 [Planctomycetota bacterium]